MPDFIDQCVALLRAAGHDLSEGLTYSEIADVQDEFGFTFSPDHAALLAAVLPVGNRWIDWRQADRAGLRSILDWPTDGTLFDVECDAFWPASWGPRPEDLLAALDVARVRMTTVPTSCRSIHTGPTQTPPSRSLSIRSGGTSSASDSPHARPAASFPAR